MLDLVAAYLVLAPVAALALGLIWLARDGRATVPPSVESEGGPPGVRPTL
jgi:hypothetical protein